MAAPVVVCMTNTMRWSTGFLFSEDREHVAVLLKKGGPSSVNGKINGIGGKLEANETPLDAMRREFAEEAGLLVLPWDPFVVMQCTDDPEYGAWENTVYRAFSNVVFAVRTAGAERVWVEQVSSLLSGRTAHPIVPNLAWLLPLALDIRPIGASVSY